MLLNLYKNIAYFIACFSRKSDKKKKRKHRGSSWQSLFLSCFFSSIVLSVIAWNFWKMYLCLRENVYETSKENIMRLKTTICRYHIWLCFLPYNRISNSNVFERFYINMNVVLYVVGTYIYNIEVFYIFFLSYYLRNKIICYNLIIFM